MTMPQRFLAVAARCQPMAADLTALLARLTLGQAFLLAGLGKLRNIDNTTTFFASLGIPLPGVHAVGIGCLELVGGGLLIIGLGVRPVAVLLLCTMAVALLTAHRAEVVGALAFAPDKGFSDVVPWMFALVLLPLLVHGAGRIAIDRLVCGRCTVAPSAG